MECTEKEFFEELSKDKMELISKMNELLKNFESKYKHVEIHQPVYTKFYGQDDDFTNFIRFTEIILSFSLEKVEDRKNKNRKEEKDEPRRG